MTWMEDFKARLHPSTAIVSDGSLEVARGEHVPAVLTQSGPYKQLIVWAPTGKKGATEAHKPSDLYHSGWHKVGNRLLNLEDIPDAGIF